MRVPVRVGALMAGLVCAASVAMADRPLIIDDADPVDFKQFKVEAGAWYEKGAGYRFWDFPFGVSAGVWPSLELGIGFGGRFEELTQVDEDTGKGRRVNSVRGLDALTVGAKWQFLGESTWRPRQAIEPTVMFPTGDKRKGLGSGVIEYDITWIASKALSDQMGAHVNVGYSFMGESSDEDVGDILHYGVALDYQVIDSLQWVGEVFAEKEFRGDTDQKVMFNTGLRWSLIDTLIVDAAAGSCLNGDAPDFIATTGLTWTFGFGKQEYQ